MGKLENLNKLFESGIVAVIRRPEESKVVPLVEALIEGGVEALEITVDTAGAYDLIQQIKGRYGHKVLVGAGTVLDPESAKRGIEAGSDFIFSPNFNEETVRITNKYGKISIPGVLTPTEIVNAYQAGADLLKIFPGSSMGINYIKELKGPLPHIPMMPTGGVNLDNVGMFIAGGASAVGVGSSLLNKEAIKNERYDEIEALAKKFVQEIKKAREK